MARTITLTHDERRVLLASLAPEKRFLHNGDIVLYPARPGEPILIFTVQE